VLESRIIDERSEWRTFSDSDKQGDDPNRVGGPSNTMLADGGLSTSIGRVQVRQGGGVAGGRAAGRPGGRAGTSPARGRGRAPGRPQAPPQPPEPAAGHS